MSVHQHLEELIRATEALNIPEEQKAGLLNCLGALRVQQHLVRQTVLFSLHGIRAPISRIRSSFVVDMDNPFGPLIHRKLGEDERGIVFQLRCSSPFSTVMYTKRDLLIIPTQRPTNTPWVNHLRAIERFTGVTTCPGTTCSRPSDLVAIYGEADNHGGVCVAAVCRSCSKQLVDATYYQLPKRSLLWMIE